MATFGQLIITGGITDQGYLTVSGLSTFRGTLTTLGPLISNSFLDVKETAFIRTLQVTGETNALGQVIASNLQVNNSTLLNTLTVASSTLIAGSATINDNLRLNSTLQVIGLTQMQGGMNIIGRSTFNSNIVLNNVYLQGNLPRNTFYVDKGGADTNKGSMYDPFLTINGTMDYITENVGDNEVVIIYIGAGIYIENITITRTNIHFYGASNSDPFTLNETTILGYVDINFNENTDEALANTISFERMKFSSNESVQSPPLIILRGVGSCVVSLSNCSLLAPKNPNVIYANNEGNLPGQRSVLVLRECYIEHQVLSTDNTYTVGDFTLVYPGVGAIPNTKATIYTRPTVETKMTNIEILSDADCNILNINYRNTLFNCTFTNDNPITNSALLEFDYGGQENIIEYCIFESRNSNNNDGIFLRGTEVILRISNTTIAVSPTRAAMLGQDNSPMGNSLVQYGNVIFPPERSSFIDDDFLDLEYYVNDQAVLFISQNLTVTGTSYFIDDVEIENDLIVTGNVFLLNALQIDSAFSVFGETVVGSSLLVSGKTTLSDTLYIDADIIINSNLLITGKTTLTDTLYVNEETILNSILSVSGNVSLNSTLYILGTATLNSNLYVSGNTTVQNNLVITGNTSLYNETLINSSLIVNGYQTNSSSLLVSGNTYIYSRLGINTNTPSVALHVVGDARIEGNVTFIGSTTVIESDVTVSQQLKIENNGTGPALYVNQNGAQAIADFRDDNVSVFHIADGGNIGIHTTNPQNALDINGNMVITGNQTIKSNLTVSSLNVLHETVLSSLTVNGSSVYQNIITINSNLIVNGETTINTTLNILGNSTFTEDINVLSNLIITGGKIGINTLTPEYSLTLNTSDAIRVPTGISSDRPVPTAGLLRFNSQLSVFEGYDGNSWISIGSNAGEIASIGTLKTSLHDSNDDNWIFTAGITQTVINGDGIIFSDGQDLREFSYDYLVQQDGNYILEFQTIKNRFGGRMELYQNSLLIDTYDLYMETDTEYRQTIIKDVLLTAGVCNIRFRCNGKNISSAGFNIAIINGVKTSYIESSNDYTVSGGVPVGCIVAGAGSTAPTGFLLCDGIVLSRGDYQELFSIIGTQYNTGGETASQFRLPNIKGRVIVGRDTSQSEFDVLGETGGDITASNKNEYIVMNYFIRGTNDSLLVGVWNVDTPNIYRLNGNVGIGTTTPDTKLHISTTNTEILKIEQENVNNNANMEYKTSTLSWNVGVGGNLSTDINKRDRYYLTNTVGGDNVYLGINDTAWNAYSDERLKDIIEPLSDGINKINEIRPVIYKFKNNEVRKVGVIAQDVLKVLPEAVDTTGEYLGVRYTELIPLLVSSIQELSKELKELKEKIKSV